MTTIVEYKRKLELLKHLENEIKEIEADPDFSSNLKFLKALDALLVEHGKSNEEVVALLDPQPVKAANKSGPGTGRRRPQKVLPVRVFRHPDTGEEIHAQRMSHVKIKEWVQQYGKPMVESWVQRTYDVAG